MTAARPLRRRAAAGPLVLLVAGAALVSCGAEDDALTPTSLDPASVHVGSAWSPPSSPGATSAPVYMTLYSPVSDRLVFAEAETGVGGEVTIRDAAADAPEAVIEFLDLTPQHDTVLEPGGVHLTIEALESPLTVGSNFEVTMHFESSPPRTTSVVVRDE